MVDGLQSEWEQHRKRFDECVRELPNGHLGCRDPDCAGHRDQNAGAALQRQQVVRSTDAKPGAWRQSYAECAYFRRGSGPDRRDGGRVHLGQLHRIDHGAALGWNQLEGRAIT